MCVLCKTTWLLGRKSFYVNFTFFLFNSPMLCSYLIKLDMHTELGLFFLEGSVAQPDDAASISFILGTYCVLSYLHTGPVERNKCDSYLETELKTERLGFTQRCTANLNWSRAWTPASLSSHLCFYLLGSPDGVGRYCSSRYRAGALAGPRGAPEC